MALRQLFPTIPLSILVAFGCSNRNPNAPASLHGKVTYNGKAVTGGTVTVHAPTGGVHYPMHIDKDGSYAGNNLPAGECVVTVETESVKPAAANQQMNYGGGRTDPQQEYRKKMQERGAKIGDTGTPKPSVIAYVKIPSRYAEPEKSPLRITLASGDQKKDLELTD
jgi:hypothetical protein